MTPAYTASLICNLDDIDLLAAFLNSHIHKLGLTTPKVFVVTRNGSNEGQIGKFLPGISVTKLEDPLSCIPTKKDRILFVGQLRPDLSKLATRKPCYLYDTGTYAELLITGNSPIALKRQDAKTILWWTFSRTSGTRKHLVSHLSSLYEKCGGIWVVAQNCIGDVREKHPTADVIALPATLSNYSAIRSLFALRIRCVVVPHFSYRGLLVGLMTMLRRVKLVVVSHGRSGKPGKGMSERDWKYPRLRSPDDEGIVRDRVLLVTVSDFYRAVNYYTHLDKFLEHGGSFTNPIPDGKAKILLLPSWENPETNGALLAERWLPALRTLSQLYSVAISPHPLTSEKLLGSLQENIKVELIEATGASYKLVPDYNVVISDLSGVFWESLLFDTPVVLAIGNNKDHKTIANPDFAFVTKYVEHSAPDDLVEKVSALISQRRPCQQLVAEARLGKIDGEATKRLANEIVN